MSRGGARGAPALGLRSGCTAAAAAIDAQSSPPHFRRERGRMVGSDPRRVRRKPPRWRRSRNGGSIHDYNNRLFGRRPWLSALAVRARRRLRCRAANFSAPPQPAPWLPRPSPARSVGTARAQQPSGAAAPGRAILIKGGCVLTLDRAIGDFEQADVLVEGGKISAVRPNISAPNAEVIDAARMIVMPGMVDTHRHMWQGILRNVLPDGSLEDYRNVVQRTFGAKYTPDDVYAGDLFSALGAIDSGVTCILDWSHIHNTPEHSDAAVKGLAESRRARDLRLRQSAERDRALLGNAGTQISRRYRAPAQTVLLERGSTAHALYGGPVGVPGADSGGVQGRSRRRRTDHHPCRRGRIWPQCLAREAQCGKGAEIGHDLYPLLHAQRHRVEADQGHRGHHLHRQLCRDVDGAWQSADPEGDRHRHSPVAQCRRGNLGAQRFLPADAHRLLAAEE